MNKTKNVASTVRYFSHKLCTKRPKREQLQLLNSFKTERLHSGAEKNDCYKNYLKQ